jgi:hypothetical protein
MDERFDEEVWSIGDEDSEGIQRDTLLIIGSTAATKVGVPSEFSFVSF